ncbi:hypothetical protein [Ensifer aridi]|uniref:hypothetical protein n=1 Tax=Ensifer aridi TaxID=1708715 RepID=UPI000A1186EE|nr:hypothetical protein [Ensifer aridi]
MAKFLQLLAVAEQARADCYAATILADLENDGTVEEVHYGVLPEDNFGIAPDVKAAVIEWINQGNPVAPFVPPTLEQIRAGMPMLSRRQLLLGLLSIGITEEMVDAGIGADTAGMIEWKNASSFERTHPLITDLSGYFQLPPEQVDSLWLWASGL